SVFLARLTAHDEKVLQVLAIGSAILVMFNVAADYFGNSFAFYGAILAFRTRRPASSLVLLSVPCVVLAGCNAEFFSIALAWWLLAASMAMKQAPRWVAWVSRYSYEFYLLHGIFFVGSMKLLRAQGFCFRSGVAISIGMAATMVASIVLNRISTSLVRAMDARGSD
ncbi:MAG: hypothetical protein ACKOAH_23105, partial [Pirellula sp.]